MSKIFSTQFNKGSLIESVSNTVGVNTATKFTQKERGMSISFTDSQTSKIDFGNLNSWNVGTGDFTIECAFRFNQATSGAKNLFSKRGTELTWTRLYVDASNIARFELSFSSGGTGLSGPTLIPGRDYIIHGIRKDGIISLYVQGVLYGTVANAYSINNTGTVTFLKFGAENSLDGNVYYGNFYNHALNQKEINDSVSDFQAQMPVSKPKRGFIANKPTDLSMEKDSVLGSQLVVNQNFSTDTWWEKEAGWSIDNGVATITNSSESTKYLLTAAILSPGKRYRVTINFTGGPALFYIGQSDANSIMVSGVPFTKTVTGAISNKVYIGCQPGATMTVSYVSVQEVTGLTAAYNMVPNGNTLVDISGNGKNGTIVSGIHRTNRGLKGNGINAGVTTPIVLPNASASICMRIKPESNTQAQYWLRDVGVTANRYYIVQAVGNTLNLTRGDNTVAAGVTLPVMGVEYDVVFTWNSSRQAFAYLNGVLVSSGTFTQSAGTGDSVGARLFSENTSFVESLKGEFIDFKVYNRILSADEIKAYHNSFIQPTLIEDFSDAPADGTAVTPREWIAGTGTYKVGENVIQSGERVLNGGFDLDANWGKGVGWTILNGTANANISTGNLLSQTNVLTLGKRYRVSFEVKNYVSGGVRLGDAVIPIINTVTANGVYTAEYSPRTGSGAAIYFSTATTFVGSIDNVSIVEIPQLPTMTQGTKYLECVTAGTIAIPSNQAYGEWSFDLFKGADANDIIIPLIADRIGAYQLSNGYYLTLSSSERIGLARNTVGSAITLAFTNTSYIANNTWYRVRITRTTAGAFTVLIKGGAFTPTAGYDGWTLVSTTGGIGQNPTLDNTYTTSNYICLDLDAGDRFANLSLTNSIKV